MRAQVGDWLIVPDPHEHHDRRGQVVELLHPDGTPPYRVRWLDDDHQSVVFPPPNAQLRPAGRAHDHAADAHRETADTVDAPSGTR